jgi:hypothetical protein
LHNPFAALAGATAANPFNVNGVSFNNLNPMPLVQQWNFGFQRQLPLILTLEVNYVGNRALHLPSNIPYNIVPLSQVDAVTLANNTQTTQLARPFPTLTTITTVDHVGSSNYNSLQVTLRRQFNSRLAILSNYTFAKSIDDGSTVFNFSAPNGTANAQYTADPTLRKSDRAVSNIDAKHTVNIAMVYTTPGRWRWIRDWRLTPVFIGHTGLPVNITQTNEITNVSQQRPNGDANQLKLADTLISTSGTGSIVQYLVPLPNTLGDPYPLTPSGPVYATINGVRTRLIPTGFGNVPRDAIRAPGEVQFDASISRDFKLTERLKFQFRVDAFNVLNHTNFNAPNTALAVSTSTISGVTSVGFNSNNFGRITSARPPREMQLSGRFAF